MTDIINQEIAHIAEAMEKSVRQTTDAKEMLWSTIRELGPYRLKKAVSGLSDGQKELLNEVLEEMKKSSYGLDTKVSSADQTDEAKNSKKKFDAPDEELNEEAKKRKMAEHRSQGGNPVEGWDGQVIKSEQAEDKEKPAVPQEKEEPTKGPKKPLEREEKCMTKSEEDKADVDEASDAPGVNLELRKKMAKENLYKMLKRMQERKIEKSNCIAALAKNMATSQEKISEVWDLVEKGYALVAPSEAAQQSPLPNHMKGEVSAGAHDVEDPSVPSYKDKNAKKGEAKKPLSSEPKTEADEAVAQVPSTMKKSEFWHEEDAVYDLAKANPFLTRTTGQNVTYTVDSYIESQSAAQREWLSKSTFDYEAGETVEKADDLDTQAVVDANQKKAADDKKAKVAEIKDIKIQDKLSRIEDRSGPKMPMLKNMKKSFINDLIEKALDMDMASVEVALSNRTVKPQGAFVVKSFSDAEFDAILSPQNMWKSK